MHDDDGLPHDDVRRLVNSLIYIKKHVPSEFLTTEHERMNLTFFAREFIQSDKFPPMLPGPQMPQVFQFLKDNDDAEGDEPDSV